MPSKMEGPSKAISRSAGGDNDSRNDAPNSKLEAKDVDVEILPIVHDIIRALEKDTNDVSQRSRYYYIRNEKFIIIILKNQFHERNK